MSLIHCTSQCVYQQEGLCSLEQAASRGIISEEAGCIHYVPKRAGNTLKKEKK